VRSDVGLRCRQSTATNCRCISHEGGSVHQVLNADPTLGTQDDPCGISRNQCVLIDRSSTVAVNPDIARDDAHHVIDQGKPAL
jgi:hypothetical protein